ncbi:hypothetical protein QLQ12_11430 [Actinoplanes sp. NEAU-A12]|uniref:Uncharacterized protein n=1 Tax=Actinoplanes sandaracinus TaxID=3045177 RepID=A0ABT6WHJ6_9ACTN|nr:hypothetical protein [Actinoplanes sandaracinus]MDI6099209.1 hypothetical protein [Actinoplanes sandaracinus]
MNRMARLTILGIGLAAGVTSGPGPAAAADSGDPCPFCKKVVDQGQQFIEDNTPDVNVSDPLDTDLSQLDPFKGNTGGGGGVPGPTSISDVGQVIPEAPEISLPQTPTPQIRQPSLPTAGGVQIPWTDYVLPTSKEVWDGGVKMAKNKVPDYVKGKILDQIYEYDTRPYCDELTEEQRVHNAYMVERGQTSNCKERTRDPILVQYIHDLKAKNRGNAPSNGGSSSNGGGSSGGGGTTQVGTMNGGMVNPWYSPPW